MQWLSKVCQSPLDSQLLLQDGHGQWGTERKSHQLCLCSTNSPETWMDIMMDAISHTIFEMLNHNTISLSKYICNIFSLGQIIYIFHHQWYPYLWVESIALVNSIFSTHLMFTFACHADHVLSCNILNYDRPIFPTVTPVSFHPSGQS